MPRSYLALFALALACLLLAACASKVDVVVPNKVAVTVEKKIRNVLENPFTLELLTLDPEPLDVMAEGAREEAGRSSIQYASAAAKRIFHGYRVLGRATAEMGDAETLINSLYRGIDENDGTVANCFNPRHGLRAERGGVVVDLVICFECHSMAVYFNQEAERWVLLTSSPTEDFNRIAELLKLPLATK